MAGNLVVGLVAIAGSGVANGSFAVPEKLIRRWRWEHVWLVYSVCALGILPVGLAALYAPAILTRTLLGDPWLTAKVGVCGLMFGAGSVLFGLSLARLGIAVTNALISGVVVFFGSVGPIVIGATYIDAAHLLWLLAGLSLLILSLALCAWASLQRERALEAVPASSLPQLKLSAAILLAVLAGLLSSMLNIGFAYGEPLIRRASLQGYSPVLATLAVWVPALLGGLLLNAGYPAYLISRAGSWRTLVDGRYAGKNMPLAGSMGALWFGSNLLYGYGALRMGDAGAVYGWALSSGASILVSNTWGVATGEWNGAASSTKALMWLSTILLIASFVILIAKRMPS